MIVLVKKEIMKKAFLIMPCIPIGIDGIEFRCGNCARGLIAPRIGMSCKVCHAKVSEIGLTTGNK